MTAERVTSDQGTADRVEAGSVEAGGVEAGGVEDGGVTPGSDITTAGSWSLSTQSGDAGALHAGSASLVGTPGASRSVRILEATDRCVVLGSTQPDSALDAGRLARSGLGWTRRRSGGAAVMVGPGEVLWVDIVVPAGDPLWVPDVGRAGWWIGDLWADALRGAGCRGVQAWRGSLVRTEWSGQVCFAGLGPGEVTVRGRKVLGLSQRRTRAGALFQCALLLRWAPEELLDVMALGDEDRSRAVGDLAGAAAGVGNEVAAAVMEGLVAGLAGR
ncbi:hypothetical protein K6U06_04940 [Acidiferrimicrobium sp. IK]|uniref:lipoyl protein ligase domain-containing protein n=1 Tax=Acidiferrimicrobium sp. IK TaxID=2871700 RepID=UPI0021CB1FD9|nr:hypothetical protein [Acidiferrimicrobium sp. IK]MCU4183696.1 hypothetical protein [Acidiferrimicrobium sp. IK]